MGELREYYGAMKAVAYIRRKDKEQNNIDYDTQKLMDAGFAVSFNSQEKAISVYESKNRDKFICKLFPYTGWWSGKGIGSGRGIHKLLNKLENRK